MAFWDRLTNRGNVEDRRGAGPVVAGGIGATGIALYLIFNLLTGGEIDVGTVLNSLESAQVQQQTDPKEFEGEDSYEVFASTVLGSNNQMWANVFSSQNRNYVAPTLVLFRQATESACGGASSASGPHYCSLDNTIYLDETFFDELHARFGAGKADVAQAYVIAHEVGHHAQNQFGIMEEVQNMSQGSDSNELSIKLELQADCFAGLWANSIRDLGVFEGGEIAEAIDAAAAVGDDRIQETVQGRVNPETWTHGSSEQRVEWFNTGFTSGNLASCETFN